MATASDGIASTAECEEEEADLPEVAAEAEASGEDSLASIQRLIALSLHCNDSKKDLRFKPVSTNA